MTRNTRGVEPIIEQGVSARAEPVVGWSAAHAAKGALPRRRLLVTLLLAVTAVKQLVLALIYPPFQGHDEVAHLAYLHLLARYHRLPTLADTIPNSLDQYSRFTLDWPALYTANHPPLYYLLAWPAYTLAGSSWLARLYAVRLVSVLLFLVTVWLSYRLALALAPDEPLLVLGVPAVIAFQPQLSFEGAIVNNDMLAILMGTAVILACVWVVQRGLNLERAFGLGLLVGLGLLSKATVTALVPVVVAAAVYALWPFAHERVGRDFIGSRLPVLLVLIIPAMVVPLPWYLFLHHTYGDFTAFRALDALQAAWGPPSGSFFGLLFSPGFQLERLREAWGYWGWKLIPLTTGQLVVIYAGTAAALGGLALRLGQLARAWRRGTLCIELDEVAEIGVLLGSLVLLYVAMIYFGTKNPLTQARYMFPAFPAGTALALLALRSLLPAHRRVQALAVVVTVAVAFNAFVLLQSVLPYAVLH